MNTNNSKVIIVPVKQIRGDSENKLEILLKVLQDHWKFSLCTIVLCLIIGLLLAFFQPPQFISNTTLLPEYARTIGYSGNVIDTQISSLISPINTSTYRGRTDAVRIDLYPAIMTSNLVLKKVLNENLVDSSNGLAGLLSGSTVIDYLLNDNKGTLFEEIKEHVHSTFLKSDSNYINLLTNKEFSHTNYSENNLSNLLQYFQLTEDERLALEILKRNVHSSFNFNTGAIDLKVRMSDPFVSAIISKLIVSNTHKIIVEYQREKFMTDYKYLKLEMDSAKISMKHRREELAEFLDQNSDIHSAKTQAEQFQLEYEFDLALSIYESFLYQVEEARLKSEEETPLFTYLNPINVPLVSEKKYLKNIILTSFIVSIVIILIKLIKSMNNG